MFNQIFKVEKKIKIIIILNIFFLSFLGIDNYFFISKNIVDINSLIKTILTDEILIGMYMPFLMLFYINSMYKKESFNTIIIVKIGNRKLWLIENLRFIAESALFIIIVFILSIISFIILNLYKYNNIVFQFNYLFSTLLYFIYLLIYLFSIGIIFLLAKLKVKKTNIALIATIAIIILDILIIRLDPNILNRFFMLYNIIYSSNLGIFSIFYWIFILSLLIFILNELKDKVDLA